MGYLTQVFFPSIVVCNKNSLRKSFGYALLKDPLLQDVSLHDLLATIETLFIKAQWVRMKSFRFQARK